MNFRSYALFLWWLAFMVTVVAGDRMWPLSEGRNILALAHPADIPVCIYFKGGLRRTSDQYREYLLLPSTFRTGTGTVIQRTAGAASAADSGIVAIRAAVFATIGFVTLFIGRARSKRLQEQHSSIPK